MKRLAYFIPIITLLIVLSSCAEESGSGVSPIPEASANCGSSSCI